MSNSATRIRGNFSFDVKLPPLPQTLSYIARMYGRPADEVELERIADLISTDMVTATWVLRRINSAYFGLRRSVGDIRHAVAILGWTETGRLVLALELLKMKQFVNADDTQEALLRIVRYGLTSACIADSLVREYGDIIDARAYSAALVLPIGRVVFLMNEPELYEAICMISDEALLPSAEEEREIFGLTWIDVSKNAFRTWNFPEDFVDVLTYLDDDPRIPAKQSSLNVTVDFAFAAASQLMHFLKSENENELSERLAGLPETEQLAAMIDGDSAAMGHFVAKNLFAIEQFVAMVLDGNPA